MKKKKENDMINLSEEEIPQDINITEMEAESLVRDNSVVYYEDILYHRAIPNVYDGLTEVQRRILWTCYDKGWNYSKPHVKSARVIGECIARFHPHSNDSAYGTSAFMSQEWKNFIPLIDFHGGKGSISGSNPSAMRYTEERSAKITQTLMFDELKYNCYDLIPNYNEDETEPVVMPSKLPMLLINGSFGIAAGYMSSIPTHHPVDVIDCLISKVKTGEMKELLPSFPNSDTKIINKTELLEAYNDLTGKGKKTSVIVRSNITHDEKKHALYITSVPFMKTVSRVIESIKEATMEREDPITKKKLPARIVGINNVKNLTSNKVLIEVKVKKDYDLTLIENQLYQFTMVQDSLPLSVVGVKKEGSFVEFSSIEEIFDEFIEFRKDTIKRIKVDIIKKYKLRIHIIDGLLIALEDIDKIIKKIKKLKDKASVVEMLMNDYDMSNIQAENIAEYKLYRLSSLEVDKLISEKETLEEKLEDELAYFKNPELLNEYMLEEWTSLRSQFTKIPKTTEYLDISIKKEDALIETIPDEDYLVMVTNSGFIKKLEIPESQKRNTKGISIGKIKDNDFVVNTAVLNSRDTIFVATNTGKVYSFKVYEVPNTSRTSLGYNISHLINNEKVVNAVPIKKKDFDNEDLILLFATKYNKVKFTTLSEFVNMRKDGLIGIMLYEGDELMTFEKINVQETSHIIALNSFGNAICVPIEKIPLIKRPTTGVNLFYSGLCNTDGGYVVSCSPLIKWKEFLFLITEKGLGKRMNLDEFTEVNRGTKGMMACKLKDGDSVVKLVQVNEDEEIIIISNKKMVTIKASDVSVYKRPTFGLKVKDLDEDEVVTDISVK